ncbi:unnamed protein product [Linum tenue]|uniref:Uncharacterized protein n=1 Tax=Linum tenue TaxID=586396 RepID=A0AAV0JSH7_9ROSI|nr:unnamed protein product [Linum tenue]
MEILLIRRAAALPSGQTPSEDGFSAVTSMQIGTASSSSSFPCRRIVRTCGITRK